MRELEALGLWNENVRARIKAAQGSIQDIAEIPQNVKLVFRTAWELPMRSLIDMAAARGAFIDLSNWGELPSWDLALQVSFTAGRFYLTPWRRVNSKPATTSMRSGMMLPARLNA